MCNECSPYGGYWRMNAAETGMERCTCEDGARAAAAAERREQCRALPPVITSKAATLYVEMLVGHFPKMNGESGARAVIANELRLMCSDDSDALDFITYLGMAWKGDWKGASEMRRAYCASRVPLDGVVDESVSEIYPDGYPRRQLATPERAALAAAPSTRMLPAGTDERRKEAPLQGEARQIVQGLAGRMPKIPEAHGKQRKEKG